MSLSSQLRRRRLALPAPSAPGHLDADLAASPSAPGDRRGAPGLPRRIPLEGPPRRGLDRRTRLALERSVSRDRPAIGAVLAAVRAARGSADLARGDDGLIPGNGAGGSVHVGLARPGSPEARRRLAAGVPLGELPPTALPPGRRPLALPPGSPVLSPCPACGGAVRVEVVDLVAGRASVECTACGLRRHEGPAPPGVVVGRSPTHRRR